MPFAIDQELSWDVSRLSLNVLRERDCDGPGVGGVGEDAHRGQRDRVELLGPLNTIEEA